jgi:hypothetical protein
VFGDTTQHEDRVARGTFADGNALVFYFADGRLVGTLQTGQDEETENQLKQLISDRATPRGVGALADESVSLDEAFLDMPEDGRLGNRRETPPLVE